jgi:hypothetical protein
MKAIVLAALSALPLCACATLTRGTTEAFSVQTTPGGAKVTTSLGMMCEPTPCVIPKVSREAEFQVTITKPGYKTITTNVSHQTSGGGGAGMAGNVILGGGIGALIDANNGATQELVPNPLVVTLESEASVTVTEAPAPPPPTITRTPVG